VTGFETQRTGSLTRIKYGMEALGEGWHTAKADKASFNRQGKLCSAMDYTALAYTRRDHCV